jgi:hypothetical protein
MADIHVIDEDSFEGVENQLKEARKKMLSKLETDDLQPRLLMNSFSNALTSGPKTDIVRADTKAFALIVNGHSLVSMTPMVLCRI